MRLLQLSVLLTLITVFGSCSKDGDAGPAGPAGAPGTNGSNGNANVTVFNYGSRVINSSTQYIMKNISQARMDSSLVLAYYNPSSEAPSSWYTVPGTGSNNSYAVRSFLYAAAPPDYIFEVRLMKPDGSGSYTTPATFTKFRIFLIPANIVLAGRSAVPSTPPVDYNDYNAVCQYYNIAP